MAREDIQSLLDEKKLIENKLVNLERVLKENKVTLSDPLLDREGFPRGDIDIPTIRSARVQILRLQNDLKEVMIKVETALHDIHANNLTKKESTDPSSRPAPLRAFAFVNSVSNDSPAFKAGLQSQDQILKFGPLQELKPEELAQLANIVRTNEEKPIVIRVRRLGNVELDLTLTPSFNWQNGERGQSLLGCHILPSQ